LKNVFIIPLTGAVYEIFFITKKGLKSSSIAFQTLVINHDIRYFFMERFMAVHQNPERKMRSLQAPLSRSDNSAHFFVL
jgi:hypothetical protein